MLPTASLAGKRRSNGRSPLCEKGIVQTIRQELRRAFLFPVIHEKEAE